MRLATAVIAPRRNAVILLLQRPSACSVELFSMLESTTVGAG